MFLAMVEPLIRQKVRIYSLAIPTWILYNDGRMEMASDGLTDEMRIYLATDRGYRATVRSRTMTRYYLRRALWRLMGWLEWLGLRSIVARLDKWL